MPRRARWPSARVACSGRRTPSRSCGPGPRLHRASTPPGSPGASRRAGAPRRGSAAARPGRSPRRNPRRSRRSGRPPSEPLAGPRARPGAPPRRRLRARDGARRAHDGRVLGARARGRARARARPGLRAAPPGAPRARPADPVERRAREAAHGVRRPGAADAIQLGSTWVAELVTLGALEPLDARLAASRAVRRDDSFAGVFELGVIDGRTWAVPWYADTRLLFYRSDLFAAAGQPAPPRSWEEWRAALAALRRSLPAGSHP